MLKQYPKFKRGEIEIIYNKLPKSEKKLIEDYLKYREARGLSRLPLKDLRRWIIQTRYIINCNFKKFDTLKKLSELSVIINNSYLTFESKKSLRINLSNLFKFLFPDWMQRFMGLDCLGNRKNKGEGSDDAQSDADLPTDAEIEEMLKSEHSTYWKTFLLYQAVTGVRTIEARRTKTKNITFNPDGTGTIEIFMTKVGEPKFVFTDIQTTKHIKKLIEEQKNSNQFGEYLFHSPINNDKPIHKNSVNKWFKNLSIKATGRHLNPYLLRKKKATELYNLSKNNIISEHTALKLMGHSRSMMSRYDKTPKDEEIKILKRQAFNLEISPEKKHKLELEIEQLKKQMKEWSKSIEEQNKAITIFQKVNQANDDATKKLHELMEERFYRENKNKKKFPL